MKNCLENINFGVYKHLVFPYNPYGRSNTEPKPSEEETMDSKQELQKVNENFPPMDQMTFGRAVEVAIASGWTMIFTDASTRPRVKVRGWTPVDASKFLKTRWGVNRNAGRLYGERRGGKFRMRTWILSKPTPEETTAAIAESRAQRLEWDKAEFPRALENAADWADAVVKSLEDHMEDVARYAKQLRELAATKGVSQQHGTKTEDVIGCLTNRAIQIPGRIDLATVHAARISALRARVSLGTDEEL